MANLNINRKRAVHAANKHVTELKQHNHVPKDVEEGFQAFFMLENMIKQACEQDPALEAEFGMANDPE